MTFDLGIIKPIEINSQSIFDDFLIQLAKSNRSIGIININSFDANKYYVNTKPVLSNEIIRVSLAQFKTVHAFDLELESENTITLKDKWDKVFEFYSALVKLGVEVLNSFETLKYFYEKNYLFYLQKLMPNNVVPTFRSYEEALSHFEDIVAKPLNGECSRGVSMNLSNSETYQDKNIIYQPNIFTNGMLEEYSLLFFDNSCVHAVRKTYVLSEHERKFENIDVSRYSYTNEEYKLGLKFVYYLDKKVRPRVWRFDFIKSDNNNLLMELESIDPFHYEECASEEYWNRLEDFYTDIT